MSLPNDPWRNPELTKPPKKAHRAWRSGRNRVFGALLITGALYAGYTLVAGEHGIVKIWKQDRTEQRLRDEIDATDERLQELDRRLENLDHTVEEKARIDHGYVGPCEEVYVVEGADSSAVSRP